MVNVGEYTIHGSYGVDIENIPRFIGFHVLAGAWKGAMNGAGYLNSLHRELRSYSQVPKHILVYNRWVFRRISQTDNFHV